LPYGDLTNGTGHRALETVDPDEVYNLGAQSHVKVSFEIPGIKTGFRDVKKFTQRSIVG
jgi:GDP-D-mannose dehydratase